MDAVPFGCLDLTYSELGVDQVEDPSPRLRIEIGRPKRQVFFVCLRCNSVDDLDLPSPTRIAGIVRRDVGLNRSPGSALFTTRWVAHDEEGNFRFANESQLGRDSITEMAGHNRRDNNSHNWTTSTGL